MSPQEFSLFERLCRVESPAEVGDWQDREGYYVAACRASREDVPGLIDIATKWGDEEWLKSLDRPEVAEDSTELLPVTAWRILADLRAEAAVEPLIGLLRAGGDDRDYWMTDELPHVFGKIGESAVAPLTQLLTNTNDNEFTRGVAVNGLGWVARYHPEARDRVVAVLTKLMVDAEQSSIFFNSCVLDELVRLHAVEAAEPIERAFAGGRLDVGLMGSREVVRRALGVEGLGLTMPEDPRNSSEQLRIDEGIGIFSPRAVFGDGETDDEAAADYHERVSEAFSASSEGQQVIQQFGALAWYASLLDFGIQYLGEIVDAMSPASVREFVLDYIPRKVSAEPDAAAGIIFELTKFWEFLDREGQLPNAQAIVDWLKADDLPGQLEEEMSDPENFGMAKSMFLMGRRAGFDMTTEAGMNEFVANFNKSRGFAVPRVTATRPPAANGRLAPASPVGRNDLCPCGSGKKFKKCCLRRG